MMKIKRTRKSSCSRALTTILAFASVVSFTIQAEAHNTWNGGYRKWPWSAGSSHYLTALPCAVSTSSPHCGESNRQAIDAGMSVGTRVYSVSPGSFYTYGCSSSGAGNYVVIKDSDGNYITYEHLRDCGGGTGAVVAGQPILYSGNTGKSSGPHLHFQRASRAPTFGTGDRSYELRVDPISGHGGSIDTLNTTTAQVSDNAGIGYTASESKKQAFITAYNSIGGYNAVGVTALLPSAWSPCFAASGSTATWWRYDCSPSSGYSGSVQTYYYGSSNKQRALMSKTGSYPAYQLGTGILGAYTDVYSGHDFVYYIGYPLNNRYGISGGYQQDFEGGFIRYFTSSCQENIYFNDNPGFHLVYTNYYCD